MLLHAMGADCRKCRIGVPYDGLAAALEAQGFKNGTLIAADRHDAGNLRRLFPEARIVRTGALRPMRRRSARTTSPRRWRWSGAKARTIGCPRRPTSEFAKIAGNVAVTPERVVVPWQPYPPGAAERQWIWEIAVADPEAIDRPALEICFLVIEA